MIARMEQPLQSALPSTTAALHDTAWLSTLDFLWLEITNTCNLQCVHCYARSGPNQPLRGDMGYNHWRSVIEEAATLGCSRVQFIGGEPTASPYLAALITDAHRSGFEFIEVFTNATRLSNSLCDNFKMYNVALAVSLYGCQPHTHDLITQREGSFAKTVSGIERAVSYDIPVRVGIVEMPENRAESQDTLDFLASMGVKHARVDKVRGVGRGDAKKHAFDQFDELCGACWKGKLAINSGGRVAPCVFSHFWDLGHVSLGLGKILSSRSLHEFRRRSRKRGKDAECNPPECGPRCFPNNCDPEICNPIHCVPLD